ncbi:MAG: hypothetical protein U0174_19610 [Polyangiaceae bacterium]
MATDSSQTKNGAIAATALVIVVALIGLKFGLDSYFITMTEAAAHEKLASPEQLVTHRETERKALSGGATNIEAAMAELGRKGRDGSGFAGPDISPRQSTDMGPMTGWSRMPKPLPEAHAAPVPPPAPPVEAGDAGAALTGDAGAPTTTDGGAHAPAPTTAAPAHTAAPHGGH